jgi:hypothetical protein
MLTNLVKSCHPNETTFIRAHLPMLQHTIQVTEVKNNHYPTSKAGPDSFPPLAGNTKRIGCGRVKMCLAFSSVLLLLAVAALVILYSTDAITLQEKTSRSAVNPPISTGSSI